MRSASPSLYWLQTCWCFLFKYLSKETTADTLVNICQIFEKDSSHYFLLPIYFLTALPLIKNSKLVGNVCQPMLMEHCTVTCDMFVDLLLYSCGWIVFNNQWQ